MLVPHCFVPHKRQCKIPCWESHPHGIEQMSLCTEPQTERASLFSDQWRKSAAIWQTFLHFPVSLSLCVNPSVPALCCACLNNGLFVVFGFKKDTLWYSSRRAATPVSMLIGFLAGAKPASHALCSWAWCSPACLFPIFNANAHSGWQFQEKYLVDAACHLKCWMVLKDTVTDTRRLGLLLQNTTKSQVWLLKDNACLGPEGATGLWVGR